MSKLTLVDSLSLFSFTILEAADRTEFNRAFREEICVSRDVDISQGITSKSHLEV
jgi:hypothetical protein